jgi:hypothetical protein
MSDIYTSVGIRLNDDAQNKEKRLYQPENHKNVANQHLKQRWHWPANTFFFV